MTFADFTSSLTQAAPPAGFSVSLQALWWAGKGDWDKAHKLVMADDSAEAAWVHAYLHRVEGDLPNARYWYRQATREPATNALNVEWAAIVSALVAR